MTIRGRRLSKRKFAITGTVGVPSSALSSTRTKRTVCKAKNSTVTVQAKRGSTTLSTRRVTIGGTCRYALRFTFASTRRFGSARSLKFVARFSGNAYLQPRRTKAIAVRLAGT